MLCEIETMKAEGGPRYAGLPWTQLVSPFWMGSTLRLRGSVAAWGDAALMDAVRLKQLGSGQWRFRASKSEITGHLPVGAVGGVEGLAHHGALHPFLVLPVHFRFEIEAARAFLNQEPAEMVTWYNSEHATITAGCSLELEMLHATTFTLSIQQMTFSRT